MVHICGFVPLTLTTKFAQTTPSAATQPTAATQPKLMKITLPFFHNRSYTTKAHENHTSVFPLVLITCMVRKHSNALFQLIRVCTRMHHCSKQLFPRLTTEGISDAATSLLMSLTVAFYRFYSRVRLLVLCFVTSTKTLLALDFAGAAGGSAAAAARGLL